MSETTCSPIAGAARIGFRRRACCLLSLVVGVVALAGCASVPGGRLQDWWHNGLKVGPNYSPPPAPVASEWIDYHDPRVRSEEQQLAEWWRVFNDPTLDTLIALAYQQNLTLRVAGARILAARALQQIAVGSFFPQSQLGFADYGRFKRSQEVANPVPAAWFSNWDAGMTASWELDFWGRYRRAIEAADGELDASVENYDDVLVVLLSDVATDYVRYRTFEQRLVYARQNVEIQEKSYQLALDRLMAGATTERDVQQARQGLEQTRALIPQLEIGKRLASNRLSVLLGMPPSRLEWLLEPPGSIPATPTDAVVGVPADLLRQRPDVRRAERQVAAQCARIGVAVSDLYPHISLVGTIGVEADSFSGLFNTPGSMIGDIGPAVRWDLLNYGRLVNGVRVQDARFQELAYAYQDRVLNAGREVEDALTSFLNRQQEAEHLAASAAAALRVVEITTDQYQEGLVDFTPVYLFQSTLAEQQDQLAATQGEVAFSLIAVYRSLGGGWQVRLGYDAACGFPPPAFESAPRPEEVPPPAMPALPTTDPDA